MTFAAHAVEVEEGLFLGNKQTALSSEFHRQHNIMLVINCTNTVPFLKPVVNNGVTYIRVPVNDNRAPEEIKKLESFIPEIVHLIHVHLSLGHNVLVHCRAGRQRSAAVVSAFLMNKYLWTHDEATSYVKFKKHDVFSPHINFYPALQEYNTHLDSIRIAIITI
jgi:protein-tyrosine phosphatase